MFTCSYLGLNKAFFLRVPVLHCPFNSFWSYFAIFTGSYGIHWDQNISFWENVFFSNRNKAEITVLLSSQMELYFIDDDIWFLPRIRICYINKDRTLPCAVKLRHLLERECSAIFCQTATKNCLAYNNSTNLFFQPKWGRDSIITCARSSSIRHQRTI